jgi:hypothetical protein
MVRMIQNKVKQALKAAEGGDCSRVNLDGH